MENQEFPKGVGFAPFLHSFMSNSSISIDVFRTIEQPKAIRNIRV